MQCTRPVVRTQRKGLLFLHLRLIDMRFGKLLHSNSVFSDSNFEPIFHSLTCFETGAHTSMRASSEFTSFHRLADSHTVEASGWLKWIPVQLMSSGLAFTATHTGSDLARLALRLHLCRLTTLRRFPALHRLQRSISHHRLQKPHAVPRVSSHLRRPLWPVPRIDRVFRRVQQPAVVLFNMLIHCVPPDSAIVRPDISLTCKGLTCHRWRIIALRTNNTTTAVSA